MLGNSSDLLMQYMYSKECFCSVKCNALKLLGSHECLLDSTGVHSKLLDQCPCAEVDDEYCSPGRPDSQQRSVVGPVLGGERWAHANSSGCSTNDA